jgi:hypothetical protein
MPQIIKPYPTREALGEAYAAKFNSWLNKTGEPHPTLPGPCWLWTKAKDSNGYGVIQGGGRLLLAHRVAYVLHHGSIPEVCLLHGCDTPLCCNPAHTHLGTHDQNMREASQRGLIRRAFGVTNQNARLTEAAVVEIRQKWAAGGKTLRGLGREHGVCDKTIRKVVYGESYPLTH